VLIRYRQRPSKCWLGWRQFIASLECLSQRSLRALRSCDAAYTNERVGGDERAIIWLRPLRPTGDACTAFAGWLAAAWPSLDEPSQSLLIDVGAALYAAAKERGHPPGGIRSGIEALLAPLNLR
jgi:hypothetical protein